MNDEDTCVYCGCYWRVSHTEVCPQVTGVYPISDFREEKIRCPECEEEIKEHYTTADDVVVCLGCAALIELMD